MKNNYHTHTKRCHHAVDVADEEYVINAISAGFNTLAFTDHVPFITVPYPEEHQDRMDYSEMDDYLATITYLKEKYEKQINIFVGFEFEYFPEYLEYYQLLKTKTDIMILGQHCLVPLIKDYGIYNDDFGVITYAIQIKECLEAKLADIVAHPDYFMLGRNQWTKACEEATHMICFASKKNHVPLEINLNGLRYGKKTIDEEECFAYPYRKFWEIAAMYGCQAIYGYDAHDPLTLLEDWRVAKVNEILNGIKLNIIDEIKIK